MSEIAMIIVALPFAYFIFILAKGYKRLINADELEQEYYNVLVKKHAKAHGIDLDKEIAKESLFKDLSSKRSFRSELKMEIMTEIFGKEKEEEKK